MGITALIAAVATAAGLLIGYQTAVIAGALPFIAEQFKLSTVLKEVLVAAILFGAFVGAVASGPLSRRCGLRPVLFVCGIIFLLGAVGSALAPSAALLLIARTLLGTAVGAASMVAPLYVAETAPTRTRGALVSLVQLAITSGILASYLVGFAYTGGGEWRLMLAWGALPSVLLMVGMVMLPESPRWLVLAGRREEARAAWVRLEGEHNVDAALDEVAASNASGDGGLRDLLAPRVRPVLVVAAGLFLFQNFSGIDGILYYAPEIFKLVGFSGARSAILATVGLGLINVVATVVATVTVDRFGRRPLLLSGLAAMVASLGMLAVTLGDDGGARSENWVALICLGVYVAAFAISLGPIPYVMMSEIFPLGVRSLGMSAASATSRGCNILVSLTFLSLIEHLGKAAVFWVYVGICAVALVFSWTMVPETRNRPLEHIEANLAAGRRARYLGEAPETVGVS